MRALGIRRVQRVDAGDGLELQLTDVGVDDREALLSEHLAVGQAQPVDLALSPASPWAQVSDSAMPRRAPGPSAQSRWRLLNYVIASTS